MAELDQLNVSTRRFIASKPALVDDVFQHDPLLAYLKRDPEMFDGGTLIQEGFLYQGMTGGGYRKGKEFDISEKQVEQAMQFPLRFLEVNVTLSKEDVQVLNKGPQAVFKLIDSRMTSAYMTAGAFASIALYLNGVNAGYEANAFNGLAEALNDGSTASWDGNTYTTYGGITRGGAVGAALNSVPVNVAGTIEYNQLEETYAAAAYGSAVEMQPNLGVTTALGYSYIKEKFQTQQRFNDTQDPNIGFNGMKFNAATLLWSRYAPGTYISASGDPNAVTYLTQTSNGAVVAYPTVTSESLWWLNARKPYIKFYLSTDPEYGFGFTGFKPAQGNTKIAGQVLAGLALTVQPRYHKQLYGITG